MKSLFVILLLITTRGLPAHAGIQAEPYFGYWSGTITQNSSGDIATKGIFYGGKLGFASTQWKFGLDYLMGAGSGNQGGSTGAYDLSAYGLCVGYEITKRLQLYGTYFIDAKAKLQEDKNPSDFSGSGFRVGVGGFGWGGLNMLGINVEYISRTYSKYNNVALSDELKEQAIGVSLSVPFPSSGSSSRSSSSPSSPGGG